MDFIFSKILAASALLGIAGCAYTVAKQSDAPDAALLTLDAPGMFPNVAFYEDGTNCSGLQQPIPGTVFFKGGNAPVRIRPGREFALTVSGFQPAGGLTYKQCDVTVSFQPEPQARYLLEFREDGNECRVRILRQTLAGTQSEQSTKRREYRRGAVESSSFCAPL